MVTLTEKGKAAFAQYRSMMRETLAEPLER